MISVMSSSLNRGCLPMNVQGIKRAAALVLSHNSRTLSFLRLLLECGADPTGSSFKVMPMASSHVKRHQHDPVKELLTMGDAECGTVLRNSVSCC
jgi:hypothetical protein